MAAPTQQEVTAVIVANDRAEAAADFVDSIKLDTQQIEGTRYRFRMTEEA